MGKQFENVNCRYGAPMGRNGSRLYDEVPRSIRLFAVNLDSGGYDDGGAYWGLSQRGERLYCADQVDTDYRQFVRAADRDSAADALEIPDEYLIVPRRNNGGAMYAYIRSSGMESARFDIDVDGGRPDEFLPNGRTSERDIFDYRAMRKLCRVSGLALGDGRGYDPDQCFRELIRPVRRWARLVTLDDSGEFQTEQNPRNPK